MKTIYKRDSKGKIRYLHVSVIDDKLIQQSGVIDTENPIIHSKVCKPKNVGKSNSTTGHQQAVSEANSLIVGKYSEGYFETKEEAENEVVILPMLAKSYDDEKHKIDWNNCYIQRKYDGQRCLAIIKDGNVTLKSRDGKIIENMYHIINDLSKVSGNVVLDGELYSEELGTFQENMKAIKKYRKGVTEKVCYNIYDVVSNLEFNSRNATIKSHIDKSKNIVFVDTIKIHNENDLKVCHKQFILEGYEGSIIRHGNKPYGVNKRCDSLLKYKDFQDIDAEIIDIEPAEQRPEWGVPVLKYSNQKLSGKSESIFRAGCKMNHEDRIDLLANKKDYIGKMANIRFFEWTDDGNPRFPVMVGIHGDR